MRTVVVIVFLTIVAQPIFAKDKGLSDCERNISFALAEGGQIRSAVPVFADKWVAKNQKHYDGLCFSQIPNRSASNYLLVFATSQSVFNGIFPTVRTNTTTSTTPVSGSGTVTDNYGGMWNYTYNGTATTTTTTTTYQDLPYADTTNTLYLYSYDQQGRLVSRRWRTITTRQGGDPSNTAGYNLGASLFAIHFKERLLKDAVHDISREPGRTEAEANSWHTQAYCERDGFTWTNNECHKQEYTHESGTQATEAVASQPSQVSQPDWQAMPDEEYAHRYAAQSWCETDALHAASAKRNLIWKDGACHAKTYVSPSPVSKP